MIIAARHDKAVVVDILTQAFDDNKSFNTIIKQDHKRKFRFRKIFEYYFDICSKYGRVYLSDDKKACAVILFPDIRKNTLSEILLDIKLLFVLGIQSVIKGFGREAKIKKAHPSANIYYLLFIGVYPDDQDKGLGSALLKSIIEDSKRMYRPMCLETYLDKNIALYGKFGFSIYDELDFGFPVFCMKRELANQNP
jgi:ribosomal protein S18 acetylase RimI-like enzyme